MLYLILNQFQTQRHPRFGDIKIHVPRQKYAHDRFLLVSPHTCEHPTTLPFQNAQAKKIEGEGMEVSQKQVNDMMLRGWSLRMKYGANTDNCINNAFSYVLSLEDDIIRLRIMSDFVLAKCNANKNVYVMEIHAMKNLQDDDVLDMPIDILRRIGGTRILIMNGKDYMSIAQGTEPGGIMKDACEIAEFRGINIEEAKKEIHTRSAELLKSGATIKVIDLPSDPVSLEKEHPMYSYYYVSENVIRSVSDFENTYCKVTRHWPSELAPFNSNDVNSVVRVMLPAPKSFGFKPPALSSNVKVNPDGSWTVG